jgi:hypothetical protein
VRQDPPLPRRRLRCRALSSQRLTSGARTAAIDDLLAQRDAAPVELELHEVPQPPSSASGGPGDYRPSLSVVISGSYLTENILGGRPK